MKLLIHLYLMNRTLSLNRAILNKNKLTIENAGEWLVFNVKTLF